LVEVPFLSISSISCLDDNVSSINDIKISSWNHSSDNVEISFNN
jgi:hypothetical protein